MMNEQTKKLHEQTKLILGRVERYCRLGTTLPRNEYSRQILKACKEAGLKFIAEEAETKELAGLVRCEEIDIE